MILSTKSKITRSLTPKKPKMTKGVEYKARSEHSELREIPSGTNRNITSPSNEFMCSLMGEPRQKKDYTKEDNGLDNKDLAMLHTTEDVGPFKVSGLTLAVESLKRVLADIKRTFPEIYLKLGTAGMRSVRLL